MVDGGRSGMTDEQIVLNLLRRLLDSGYHFWGEISAEGRPFRFTVDAATLIDETEADALTRWYGDAGG